jgi:SAM-dependent methyltransferase
MPDPVAVQRAYYARTAGSYDEVHALAEHRVALGHVVHYLRALQARTVLDTGCGTGMALRFLQAATPEIEGHGNDPSVELLQVAVDRYGLDPARLRCCSSERLPYPDGHFDAVLATGVMHHVPDAEAVVREMVRVARRAIFVSDINMFGLGSLPARTAKLALRRAGLLRRLNRRRRGGHDWYYTDGDGVAWDYSVFDSLATVRGQCHEVLVLPTGTPRRLAEAVPLLGASHCLLAAFKEPFART